VKIYILFLFTFISTFAHGTQVEIGLASNFSEISTGSSNPYGRYFRNGVDLAVKAYEARLNAKKIEILIRQFDYGTNEAQVLKVAREAAASRVVAVIGYNYSSDALLAAPIHQESKLPMLLPSASANRLSSFGDYIHLASFSNESMGKGLAQIAFRKLKARRVLTLPAGNCAYCNDLADSFTQEFEALGGRVPVRKAVLSDDRDFSQLIRDLKVESFDAILVPNQELVSARIIKAFLDAGINKPFIGGDGWGDLGREFFEVLKGKTVKGTSISHWHIGLTDKKSNDFKSRYKALSGQDPNDTAVLAYDTTCLLLEGILKSKSLDRVGIENALNSIKSFDGVTGKFQFIGHQAPKKSMVVLDSSTGEFKVIGRLSPEGKGAIIK
jgi:branched-chain amino acid transport system substrate-binding protein